MKPNELNRVVMGTKAAWTPERRAKQADIIAQTRPWEKATGPRTERGKAISCRNAYTGAAEASAVYRAVQVEARAQALRCAERLAQRLQQMEPYNSESSLDEECADQSAFA